MHTDTTKLSTEAKAWIKAKAKSYKINPVGKSLSDLVDFIAIEMDCTTSMVVFLANGGEVKELPGFEGIKPLPNRKETCAGGKTEPAKKTPRKLSKESKPAKEPKAPKAPKDNSGLVTLASILEELGVEGRIARRKLRGSDIAKPGAQWEWEANHADIAKVRKLLAK